MRKCSYLDIHRAAEGDKKQPFGLFLTWVCLTLIGVPLQAQSEESEDSAEQVIVEVYRSEDIVLTGKSNLDLNEQLDEDLEAIVVTGTRIATGIYPVAVPLTTLSTEDLNRTPSADLKDIFRNLSFNASSLGLSSSNWVGDDGSYGSASINIRNLGNGATLVLLNGKRIIASQFNQNGGSYVDIQTVVPNIALKKIEILKDGTSAIYGSDAVAGVVNLLTRDNFRGFESRIFISQDHESGQQRDATIELMYGAEYERSKFTVSASLLRRGELLYADRFERFGRSGLSSFGQPGRYVPLVDAGGPLPVASNYWWPNGGPNPSQFQGSLPDPECEKAAQDDGTSGTLGIHPDFPFICVYDYSSFFAMVRPEDQYQIHIANKIELSERETLQIAIGHFNATSSGENSYYPDVRYVIVPVHNFGLQLDAARRGFEPVPYQAMQRILGGSATTSFGDRPVDTRDYFERNGSNLLLELTSNFDLFDRNWDSNVSLAVSSRKIVTHLPTDSATDRTNLAFDGFGGPDCDPQTGIRGSGNLGTGNCYYYNSFQTSVYDPATGERWSNSEEPWGPDPSLSVNEAMRKYRNPPELLQWLHAEYRSDRKLSQYVLDIAGHTNIGRFRGHPIGFATGIQFRRNSAESDYDDLSNEFGFSFLSGDVDWSNDTSSWSIFGEAHVRISSKVQVNLALRGEQIRNPDAVSLDPKISLLANPADDFSIRISAGTSFKTGSLLQTGGSRTIFQNSSDPFSNAASLAYRASQARGNPNLDPETARSLSVGFTWKPFRFEGLEINADWYGYVYNELIIREGHQELIDIDNSLRCPNGVNGDPNTGPLCGVWDHDNDGVETVFSIGTGIPDKVIRRADGYLVRTEPRYLNANELTTSGLDIELAYSFSFESAGNYRVSASVARFLEYELTLRSGETIIGIGKRNATNSIARPMPKTRSKTSVHWTYEQFGASVDINHIGGYRDESRQTAFLGAYLGYADYIEAMTSVDAQFRWCVDSVFGLDASTWLSFGIKNLLNREPPLVIVDGAFDYYSHDPRGRIYHLKVQSSAGSGASCT